jgi:hypothetical protein
MPFGFVRSRARIALVASLASLATALAVAAPAAHAGSWDMASCATGAQSLGPFTPSRTIGRFNYGDSCGTSGGHMDVYDDGGADFAGSENARYTSTFTTGAHTTLSQISVRAALEQHNSFLTGLWANTPGGAVPFASGTPAGGWQTYTTSGGGATGFFEQIRCPTGVTCVNDGTSHAYMKDVVVTFSDTTGPTVSSDLVDNSSHNGSFSIGVTAHDQGAGVQAIDVTAVPQGGGTPQSVGSSDLAADGSCANLLADKSRTSAPLPGCPLDVTKSYTLDTTHAPFQAGKNTVKVCATDYSGKDATGTRSGNSSTPCEIKTITVDNIPPDTTIDSGPENGDATKDRNPIFTFHSPDATVTNFDCELDGVVTHNCVSPKGYMNRSDGPHTFKVTAIDPTGNPDGSPASRTWTIDNSVPSASISSDSPSGEVYQADATFHYTSNEAPDVSYRCALDRIPTEVDNCPADGKTFHGLGNGPHTFYVYAKDRAGNDGSANPATRTWTVIINSAQCQDPTARLYDGFAGTTYVKLRAQRGSATDPDKTIICFRADNGNQIRIGGDFELKDPSGSLGVPTLENDTSNKCLDNKASNEAAGPHPVVAGHVREEGDIGYTPFSIDDYAKGGESWICISVGDFQKHVVIPVPSGNVVAPTFNADDPSVGQPVPKSGPAGYPSSTCQNDASHSQYLNGDSTGNSHLWFYSSQTSPTDARFCARVEGPVTAGGMLELDATGAPGVAPHIDGPLDDTSPCSHTELGVTDPVVLKVQDSPSGAQNTSICVTVGTTGKRFTIVNDGGGLVAPRVKWTPDPDTPGGPLP